jgi:hypothetical protein
MKWHSFNKNDWPELTLWLNNIDTFLDMSLNQSNSYNCKGFTIFDVLNYFMCQLNFLLWFFKSLLFIFKLSQENYYIPVWFFMLCYEIRVWPNNLDTFLGMIFKSLFIQFHPWMQPIRSLEFDVFCKMLIGCEFLQFSP